MEDNPTSLDLYPLSRAATMIPSPYGGHISYQTLLNWVHQGRAKAFCRTVGRRTHYFISHEEIERLRGQMYEPTAASPEPSKPTSASTPQHRSAVRRCEEILKVRFAD